MNVAAVVPALPLTVPKDSQLALVDGVKAWVEGAVTETVTAAPGAYEGGLPGVLVHVTVTDEGEAVRFDPVTSVRATDLVVVSVPLATVVPVWESVKSMVSVPVAKFVQGAATEPTENVKVVLVVLFNVPVVGEIVSPAGATGVTITVSVDVRVFFAVTVKVEGAPTRPVVVLHDTPPLIELTLISEFDACMLPAQTVNANNPPSARALRFRNVDKSMSDLPFSSWCFLRGTRREAACFQVATPPYRTCVWNVPKSRYLCVPFPIGSRWRRQNKGVLSANFRRFDGMPGVHGGS